MAWKMSCTLNDWDIGLENWIHTIRHALELESKVDANFNSYQTNVSSAFMHAFGDIYNHATNFIHIFHFKSFIMVSTN